MKLDKHCIDCKKFNYTAAGTGWCQYMKQTTDPNDHACSVGYGGIVYTRNKPMSERHRKQFENRKNKFSLLRKQAGALMKEEK